MRPALCRAELGRLVIVDVQPRLAAAMAASDRARVLQRLSLLLDAAVLLEVPVLVTEQYPRGLGSTEPQLAERLPPSTPVLTKTSFSCCGAEGFLSQVTSGDRPQIVLGGIESHVCVLQTALDLAARGLEPFVVEDAVCSRDPSNHANAMDRLRQAGVTVTNAESVIFEWLADATHPRFKTVSALLK